MANTLVNETRKTLVQQLLGPRGGLLCLACRA